MNLEHVRRFLVVAEYLNFTAAAEHMYIGQSTLSRQIAALEESLGVALLIRGPRSLQLTDAGRVLYEEGMNLIEHLENVEKKTVAMGKNTAGTINVISVPAYFDVFNRIYAVISGMYHDLEVRLTHQRFETICRDVESGKADVGLIYDFLMKQEEALYTLPIARERFAVLCNPRHPLSGRKSVSLAELEGENIIHGAEGPELVRSIRSTGTFPRQVLNVGQRPMENLILDIRANQGIALLPRSEISFQDRELVQVPVSDEDISFDVLMVYRRCDNALKLRQFLGIVRSTLKGR